MKKSVIAIVVVVLVLGAVVFILAQDSDNAGESKEKLTAQTETSPADDVDPAATISYNDSGFTDNETRVSAGSTVLIRNDSTTTILHFSSDDHPIHADNQELNAETIGPGETTTIVVRTPGTWGFHNHVVEDHTGTLVVE